MNELFLATEHGNIPIDENIKIKYNLKRGMKSPFSNHMIVDKDGNSQLEQKAKKTILQSNDENHEESRTFSVAEMVDIAQGADSN